MNLYYESYLAEINPDDWEFFAVDFLCCLYGFSIHTPPARGADNGIDAILVRENKKYIFSCKHYNDKSIGVSDEINITDRMKQVGAQGFIGFYSNSISQKLLERFRGISKNNNDLIICYFDKNSIIENLNEISSSILDKYSLSTKIKYPIHIPDEYRPLPCMFCKEDILEDKRICHSMAILLETPSGKIGFFYGCKSCLDNFENDNGFNSSCWIELNQALHREQFITWNNVIDQITKGKEKMENFDLNRGIFDRAIQQRMVSIGTWI